MAAGGLTQGFGIAANLAAHAGANWARAAVAAACRAGAAVIKAVTAARWARAAVAAAPWATAAVAAACWAAVQPLVCRVQQAPLCRRKHYTIRS